GHESQVPNPGDFFVSRMGGESVILTRDSNAEISVLLNSCRHRGMKVCRYDVGNTLQFTCPYHGWSYSIDGSLVSAPGDLFGVPQFRDSYGGQLRKEDWGLVKVARIANYRGLIFATWDADAVEFDEYIGGFRFWLNNLADSLGGVEAGAEVFGGVIKWRVPAKWKFVSENFIGDAYHAATSHSSVEAAGIGPAGVSGTRHGVDNTKLRARQEVWRATSFKHLGHGATDSADEVRVPPVFTDSEALTAYFGELNAAKRAKREADGHPLGAHGPATLFPSMSIHALGFPKTILVAHPISPWETEMWRWFVVDKDATPEAREWLRHYYMRYSGPAGMTEQDDMENWNYATEASRGVIARRYPYNYSQGLGMTAPSTLDDGIEATFWATEENARNFYGRWSEFVSGTSWDDLMAGARQNGSD
ncbi:aromatic ring-hydroxylating dioxygenase subunit alpha, partial [Microbacterium sp.]|uniref:aromatic ring-hydroxylating dioxygenase subunit alpha n=1 Tax=Microbacterium sp. TaxID=51671 RepID=UPI0027376F9D